MKVDASGRIRLPKAVRDALGLAPGTSVHVSIDDGHLSLTPAARTARLRRVDGHLVADTDTDTVVTDRDVVAAMDEGRR